MSSLVIYLQILQMNKDNDAIVSFQLIKVIRRCIRCNDLSIGWVYVILEKYKFKCTFKIRTWLLLFSIWLNKHSRRALIQLTSFQHFFKHRKFNIHYILSTVLTTFILQTKQSTSLFSNLELEQYYSNCIEYTPWFL